MLIKFSKIHPRLFGTYEYIYMNGLAFDKTLNTSILRHYLDFLDPPALLRLFSINWTPPLLLYFMTLTSCKKSEKTDQPILRFCVANIDKRTDRRNEPNSLDTSVGAVIQKRMAMHLTEIADPCFCIFFFFELQLTVENN